MSFVFYRDRKYMADAAAYDKRHKSNPLKLRKGTRVQYHTHIKKNQKFSG